MTPGDLIYNAYKMVDLLGAPERVLATSYYTDGLKALNGMIDNWKIDRLMVYGILRSVHDLVSGQRDYTIGPSGADWTLERPNKIEDASILLTYVTPNIERHIDIMTAQVWAEDISLKTLTSLYPYRLYYQRSIPSAASPMGMISVHPVPMMVNSVVLYTHRTVDRFATIDDVVYLQDGYQDAIETNLALRLAGRNPKRATVSQLLRDQARDSKLAVERINGPNLTMINDYPSPNRPGWYDIRSNRYF